MHLAQTPEQSSKSPSANSARDSVAEAGFAILPGVLAKAQRDKLGELLGPGTNAGRRGILELPVIAKLAGSDGILNLVRPHLSAEPRPVRGIYFDKSAAANWFVAWHQDLTIAVREKIDVPGFGPWSIKAGVPHVQPPVQVLKQMLAVRLHLDDCSESNGALRVIPGSHRAGRLSTESIRRVRMEEPAIVCCVPAGVALLMRPLLLHSSGGSRTAGRRRVIHIEYAAVALPDGLQWHETG